MVSLNLVANWPYGACLFWYFFRSKAWIKCFFEDGYEFDNNIVNFIDYLHVFALERLVLRPPTANAEAAEGPHFSKRAFGGHKRQTCC
ncbi:hypothetical protein RIF29_28083 [Crotalaria pallida]|uniref:Uncharacterized protein n=1 Tax=Crotalaria pallida TaxID=3830 RepID=A0AAN9EQA7_CROPI